MKAGIITDSDMKIKLEKLTDISLLHKANSFTTGKTSKMSLSDCYKSLHSNCRTQLFWIEMRDIPLFCASQFVRSKVGVEWYQRSKRTDRGGADFREVCKIGIEKINHANEMIDYCCPDDPPYMHIGEAMDYAEDCFKTLPNRFDRYAPTDLACLINAEAIINMSHKRLCAKASKETREIWIKVISELAKVDPCLIEHCLPPCVASGLCREPKSCGFTNSDLYKQQRESYLRIFE